ncbi:MAG: 2-phosphosulfolactate phosphatase [Ignavibacteria bacterium]|nr:2-phosphosulfolactate phosphatase [Ignavibacteria bacterium]
MKIDVLFFTAGVPENYFTEKNCVVIDLLRATSTIITALNNGAREIIPIASVDEAIRISKNLDKNSYLLCGERQAKKIDGFDLGNSPLEYTEDKVKGKILILSTTNGTKVFNHLKNAKKVILASAFNISAVVDELMNSKEDWTVICSGSENMFDASDALCAGLLIHRIRSSVSNKIELNDAASLSLLYFEKSSNEIEKTLSQTEHGRYLIENNFGDDIKFISQIDLFNNVVHYKNNLITTHN